MTNVSIGYRLKVAWNHQRMIIFFCLIILILCLAAGPKRFHRGFHDTCSSQKYQNTHTHKHIYPPKVEQLVPEKSPYHNKNGSSEQTMDFQGLF